MKEKHTEDDKMTMDGEMNVIKMEMQLNSISMIVLILFECRFSEKLAY